MTVLPDVQALPDQRGIPLEQVGVRGLRYPVDVRERTGGIQRTVAEVSMSVALPAHVRGAHLSRFVEVLAEHIDEVSAQALPPVLAALRRQLEAERVQLTCDFPYFIQREAPITGARALMDYQCRFRGEGAGEVDRLWLTVGVPVATVCPCSKAISDYGAHNQRGTLTLEVLCVDGHGTDESMLWIEDLVDLAEACASSPLYPLLKRPDERHVTMQGFDNPVFVEDLVREAACKLGADPRVAWFSVEAATDESIHNHAAFARVSAEDSGSAAEHLG
jgi:GTP cyclohydrolase I